jgi:uncharacterized protein YndB with AHSA1/START domain
LANVASIRISSDQDTIVSEIEIAVPTERVFQAITDPRQVPLWWGQAGVYRCEEFKAELRPGGQWRSSGIGPDGCPFAVTGQYLEVDPPRLLVHTWIASWTGDAQTTVRWELEPTATGTLLRLRHSGLGAHPGIRDSYRGWPRMLGWIQALLEKGETVQDRNAA